jgi:UDP-glucose 4-epimerase
VYGNGKQISDMVYVGDVAEALVRALTAASEGVVFDKAIEIGPSESKTVNDVAEFINRLCSNKHIIKHLPMRPGEIKDAKVAADTRTLGLIGMDAKDLVPLNIGMRETVKYFKESQGKAWSTPEPKPEPDQKTCTAEGCDEPGFPYCPKHNAP